MSDRFPTHTLETAPAESRPLLEAEARRFGFLPLPLARHASAPALLEGFARLHALFESTSLSPLEREALVMVVGRSSGCNLCLALHRRLLEGMGAPAATVAALVDGRPVPDDRLGALVEFVEETLGARGGVGDEAMDAFVGAGYTPRQALEVVVGIATYTLSTFANRMTRSETLR